MEKNNRNNKQDIIISKMDNDISWIKKEITSIKDNHLASIYKKLEAQKNWIIGVLIVVIGTLVASVFNLIK